MKRMGWMLRETGWGCGGVGRVVPYSYAKDKVPREEKNHKKQRKGKEL